MKKYLILILILLISPLAHATPVMIVNNVPETYTVTPAVLQPSDITDVSSVVTINAGVSLPTLHSNSGTRYLCVNSIGTVSSSASACSGT